MQKEDFKQKIKDEIDKTEQLIVEYKEMTKPVAPDVAIGRISRMDAINNQSVTESALRQAESKLRDLHYALTRVDSPGFGICAKCRNPIPLGRILIKPESRHCVNCAQ